MLRNILPTAILAVISAASLAAQTTPTVDTVEQLAPVVVTGDLWGLELARTAASVTVLDSSRIAASGSATFEELSGQIPNLTWTGGTSRARYFQIRGIGENSQFEGETPDSSVRFLIDDLDFTGLGGVAGLFDVTQVEVLRGPQAGAFGANAAGGVIKVVTAAPTSYWTGLAEGTVGDDALRSGGLAIGGPLLTATPEKLTFRLAVFATESDGFRDNRFLGRSDTNARDEFMTRLKLHYAPTPAWTWDATVFYADQDNGYDEFSLDNTGFDTYSDEPGRDTQESIAGSLRGTWTGNDFAFTTKTAATHTDSVYSYDSDWTFASDPRTYDSFLEIQRQRDVFNQELRLDSVAGSTLLPGLDRWTIGLYYDQLKEDTWLTEDFGGASSVYDARTTALFLQAAHDFSDATRLVLGLRAEDYQLATQIEFRDDLDFDDTLFGGKLTLEQDLTPQILVFGSVARGYKAGGVNPYNFLVVPDEGPATYATETMWNYEIGLRFTNPAQTVRAELVAFYLDRHDAQVRDSAGFGSAFTYFVDNGNRANISGLEASGQIALTDTLSINGSLGLMDSHIDSFTLNNTAGDIGGGRELANVPDYTYSLGLSYAPDQGFFASAGVSGRSAYFESNTHEEKRSAYSIVDARLGYRFADWEIALWARNLLDESYEKKIFFFGNAGPNYETTRYESPADPRQIGATLRYRF